MARTRLLRFQMTGKSVSSSMPATTLPVTELVISKVMGSNGKPLRDWGKLELSLKVKRIGLSISTTACGKARSRPTLPVLTGVTVTGTRPATTSACSPMTSSGVRTTMRARPRMALQQLAAKSLLTLKNGGILVNHGKV